MNDGTKRSVPPTDFYILCYIPKLVKPCDEFEMGSNHELRNSIWFNLFPKFGTITLL